MASASVAGSGVEHLSEIIQFWRIQQIWERLLGMTDAPLSELPPRYLARLLDQSGVDSLPALIEKKRGYSEDLQQALQNFFATVQMSQQDIDDWQEQAVQWAAS